MALIVDKAVKNGHNIDENELRGLKQRNCPICDSEAADVICSFEYKFPNSYNMDSICDVVCCRECGFVFNRAPSNYESHEKHAKENNRFEGFDRNFYNYAADYIKDNFQTNVKILDVGCSVGNLLFSLKNLGYTNLCGVDPSAFCIEHINKNGINGKAGSVYDEFPEYEKQYDVITFTNVLEHLTEPKKAILNLKRWLKEDGTLFISVPYGDFYHLNGFNFSLLICAEHVCHFTVSSLDYLLFLCGFEKTFTHISDDKSAFQCVYRKLRGDDCKLDIKKDRAVRESVEKSYNNFLHVKRSAKEKLSGSKGKPLAVWGMSHYLMSMLPDVFNECDIRFIVDSDARKQGLEIEMGEGGIPVVAPHCLNSFEGAIVVLSNSSKESILKAIKDNQFENDIIIL